MEKKAFYVAAFLAALVLTPLYGAGKDIHSEGSERVRFLAGANREGRSVEVVFAWDVPAAPGTSLADRIAFAAIYHLGVRFSYLSDDVWVDGEKFNFEGSNYKLQDITVYSVSYTFDVYFGNVPVRTFKRHDTLPSGKLDYAFFDATGDPNQKGLTDKEVVEGYKSGISLRNFKVTEVEYIMLSNLRNEQKNRKAKAAKAADFLAQGDRELQNNNLPEAKSLYQKAAAQDPSLESKTRPKIAQIDTKMAQDKAKADQAAQAKQGTVSNPATGPVLAVAAGTSGSQAGAGTMPPNQPSEKRTVSKPQVYQAPRQTDQGDYTAAVNRLIAQQNQSIQNMERTLQEGTDKIMRQINFSNRWNQASHLESTGGSPEQMIAEANQKKQELNAMSRQQKEEMERELEKLQEEFNRKALEEKNSDTAVLGAIVRVGGSMVGNYSIEQSRRDAQRRLDDDLTREFRKIQKNMMADAQKNRDAAFLAAAASVFPEEEAYLRKVYDYYNKYLNQLDKQFSIDNTDWLYPRGSLPQKPNLPAQPVFTQTTLAAFLSGKMKLVEAKGKDAAEAQGAAKFLTDFALKQFPTLPEGYFYYGRLSTDIVEKVLMTKSALRLAPKNQTFIKEDQQLGTQFQDQFFQAVDSYNTAFIKRAWDTGLPATFKDPSGKGVYHHALLLSDPRSLDYLLSLNTTLDKRQTAQDLLFLAAIGDYPKSLPVLIKYGAQVDVQEPTKKQSVFMLSCDNGSVATMETLIKNYNQDPVANFEAAHSLRIQGAQYHLGRYLMRQALEKDDPALLYTTVQYDPTLVLSPYSKEDTFISASVRLSKNRILGTFLNLENAADGIDISGKPLLAVAREAKRDDGTFSALLKVGFDPTWSDDQGKTILHWAAENGREAVLLETLKYNADVNQRDSAGRTALQECAGLSEKGIAALLDAGTDMNIQDREGKTALHLAIERKNQTMITQILSRKGNTTLQDAEGNTPLHRALLGGYTQYALFLVHPIAVDSQNKEGLTPVHLLISRGTEAEALGVLKANTVNLTVRDSMGNGYLHTATAAGKIQVVSYLITQGVPVNTADTVEGKTPLHIAAQANSQELVKLLLDAGANKHAKTKDKKKPAALATDKGIVKMINDYGMSSNPMERVYAGVVRWEIDVREDSGFIAPSKTMDWGVQWAKTEAKGDGTFIGIALPLLSGPGSYGKFYGIDMRLLYGGDAGTRSQDGQAVSHLTGLSLVPGFLHAQRVDGGAVSLTMAQTEQMNGLIFSPYSRTGTLRGVGLGFWNEADQVYGIQIGLFNRTNVLRGLQIGVFNISGDRKFALVNWGF